MPPFEPQLPRAKRPRNAVPLQQERSAEPIFLNVGGVRGGIDLAVSLFMLTVSLATPRRTLAEPPGGPLMWLVVGLELLTFSIVFVLIALLRGDQADVFREGQRALDPREGLALTLTLVTSGYFAAEAVHACRTQHFVKARRFYVAALASGVLFVGLKLRDYAALLREGHHLGSDDFWDAYFLSTGFHLVHVVVGLVLLGAVAWRVGNTRFEDEETAVAGTALFWHLCDLAWFFLFPLFFARGTP